MSNGPVFSIGDVFSDAFASFRRRFGLHLGFNAIFIALLFVSFCLIGCVLSMFMGVGTAALSNPNDPTAGVGAMGIVLVLVYGVMLLFMLFAMAFHHGFTLDASTKDIRGIHTDLSTSIQGAGERLPAHTGFVLIRMLVDMLPSCLIGCVFAMIIGAGAQGLDPARFGSDPSAIFRLMGEFIVAFAVAYLLILIWIIVVRGFFGLAAATIQVEGLGPIAAMKRSVELLSGRRLQFIALRVLWAIAAFLIYLLLYAPMFAVIFLAGGDSGQPNPAIMLILFPYMIAFYFAMFLLYSFDSVLEAAYYARTSPSGGGQADVAQVFV